MDLAQKKVTQTLNANVNSANRLKFTPDGKLALVSVLNGADLSIFDVATRTLKKKIPIGHGAAGIEMNPDGSKAYVACTPDNYVVVVDLKTLEVTSHLDAGKNPDGMAWVKRP
jgi:YVTN family beta-propeller protein